MNVYIEYVIIDNFILDYLLLKLTFTVKKASVFKRGLFVGALVGTVFAVLLPLINLSEALLFLVKILSGIVILLCSAKFKSVGQFLKTFNLFLLLTFLFGGAFYGLFSLLGLDYTYLYGTSAVFPIAIILLVAIAFYKVLYQFFCKLYQNKLVYPFVRKCSIVHNGQKITVNGFIDSGNQLIYNNFYSVNVASKNLVNALLTQGFFDNNQVGEMFINTVSGKSKIKIFEFDSLEIYSQNKMNIIKDVKIGVLQDAVDLSEDYDLILSCECDIKGV